MFKCLKAMVRITEDPTVSPTLRILATAVGSQLQAKKFVTPGLVMGIIKAGQLDLPPAPNARENIVVPARTTVEDARREALNLVRSSKGI